MWRQKTVASFPNEKTKIIIRVYKIYRINKWHAIIINERHMEKNES